MIPGILRVVVVCLAVAGLVSFCLETAKIRVATGFPESHGVDFALSIGQWSGENERDAWIKRSRPVMRGHVAAKIGLGSELGKARLRVSEVCSF